MKENLANGDWIIKPYEMVLNLRGSHPIIDSLSFVNSQKFQYLRKICIRHLI